MESLGDFGPQEACVPTERGEEVAANLQPFWVSWWGENGSFELHSPWWISGYRLLVTPASDAEDGTEIAETDQPSICAAVMAADEEAAASLVRAAHDDPNVAIEWRFINPREAGWEPFCDRFRRADWMRWP